MITRIQGYNKQTNFMGGTAKRLSIDVDLSGKAPKFSATEIDFPTKQEFIESLKALYLTRISLRQNKNRKVDMHAYFPLRANGKRVG